MEIIFGVVLTVFILATILGLAVRLRSRKGSNFRIGTQHISFIISYLFFSLYAISMILSFLILISYSFENKIIYEINLGQPFKLPQKLVLDNYVFAFNELQFRGTSFFGMIGNSLWYTTIAIIGPVFMNTCVGYAVSKYKFKARGLYYGAIIFSMTIPIIGTTGAMFKLISDLNLYDTGPLFHIILNLGAGGMGFLVMYAYFKNISWEYAEAAFIDGAGHFMVFFSIMIPMATPAMGALAILGGIGAWNAYMEVLLFLPSWPTLASGLYGLSRVLPRLGNTPAYYAALVIACIPILLIFTVFSNKIMQNFSVGGLKG